MIAGVRGELPHTATPRPRSPDALVRLPAFAEFEDVTRACIAAPEWTRAISPLPLEQYAVLNDFGDANDIFIEHAVATRVRCGVNALDEAGLRPQDVDLIVSTTVTGIAVPSIEARIANVLGMRDDVRRVPMFGLGCVAGAAGWPASTTTFGAPDGVAVLVSVGCSLTYPGAKPGMVRSSAAVCSPTARPRSSRWANGGR